jgi:DNA polymerase
MDTLQKEFSDIVTQVRTHVELQRALGVSSLQIVIPDRSSPAVISAAPIPGTAPEPPVKRLTAPEEAGGLASVCEELGGCTGCRLSKGRKTVVAGEGNPDALLVFIGEAPGQEEDKQGRPFVGEAGQLLTDIIVKGMKLQREDVYICTIVKCRPPDDRPPEPDEIAACEGFLLRQIAAIKPRIIVALGRAAAQTMMKTKEGITSLRGKWGAYQGIPVMPTFHPAHLLRKPSDKKAVWEDIRKVMAEIEKIKNAS